MKEWREHTQAIREHLDELEENGHLDGSAPAFLAHVDMAKALDELEEALRERDSMKGESP